MWIILLMFLARAVVCPRLEDVNIILWSGKLPRQSNRCCSIMFFGPARLPLFRFHGRFWIRDIGSGIRVEVEVGGLFLELPGIFLAGSTS